MVKFLGRNLDGRNSESLMVGTANYIGLPVSVTVDIIPFEAFDFFVLSASLCFVAVTCSFGSILIIINAKVPVFNCLFVSCLNGFRKTWDTVRRWFKIGISKKYVLE